MTFYETIISDPIKKAAEMVSGLRYNSYMAELNREYSMSELKTGFKVDSYVRRS